MKSAVSQRKDPPIILSVLLLVLLALGLQIVLHVPPLPQPHEFIKVIDRLRVKPAFESFQLPADFELIESSYGNKGALGTASLKRRYKVHGTREEIIRKLEPLLRRRGYVLRKHVADIDYDYQSDWHTAYNSEHRPALLNIELHPLDTEVTRPSSSNINRGQSTEVNEVVLELYQA